MLCEVQWFVLEAMACTKHKFPNTEYGIFKQLCYGKKKRKLGGGVAFRIPCTCAEYVLSFLFV